MVVLAKARALTHTALLTYRYLFVFLSDFAHIRAALAARGFRPQADAMTARTFAAVTGGLLLRSLARTERTEQAMRCRGYTGELVIDPPRPLASGDVLLVCAAVVLALGLVGIDYGVLTQSGQGSVG